jgi:2-C-methyl-D-erythritol 4-phosphate cytidylyltransferase
VVAALQEPPITDFAALAADLGQRFPIVTEPAPAAAARVRTVEDVRTLEALTTP